MKELDAARDVRNRVRNDKRELQKSMIRVGSRPKREKGMHSERVRLCSVNATCASSTKAELEFGIELTRCDSISFRSIG